jgi:hypothetical protein
MIVCENLADFVGFSSIYVHNRECESQPDGNKESNSQLIGTKFDQEWRILNLECAEPLAIHTNCRTGKFEYFRC